MSSIDPPGLRTMAAQALLLGREIAVQALRRQPIVPKPADVPRGTVYIIAEECKGCGLCIDFCPRGVLKVSEKPNAKGHNYPVVVKEGECANCQMCYLICSEFAIFSTPAVEMTGGTETRV